MAFGAPWAAACGSRGPLEDTLAAEPTSASAEAGDPDAASATEDATADANVPDGRRPPDASLPRDAGPVQCGLCVAQQCSPGIVACIQNPACTAVFQCVIQTCLLGGLGGDGGGGGGGFDPSCLLQCGAGNIGGALQVFQIFNCITQTCGPECNSVIGGFLGGGGGGGGFGGFGGGNAQQQQAHEDFKAVLSPWPQLFTPVDPPR